MKYQQQEGRIITACNSCCFYKDGDCQDGRIEKFKIAGKLEYEADPIITGRCLLKRTKEWAEEKENPLEQAKDQLKPSFGLSFIDIENKYSFKKIVEEILKIDYDPERLSIHISTSKIDASEKMSMFDLIKNKFSESLMTFTFETDKYMLETYNFEPLSSKDYLISLNGQTTVDKDVLNKVNEVINDKLKNVVYFEFGGQESQPSSIIFTRAVRSTYLEYCDYRYMEKFLRKESKLKSLYCNLDEE
tara:strand:- start:1834 stop:2571 length:738 start_codon:yes stop_codon:yes gene_type:complete